MNRWQWLGLLMGVVRRFFAAKPCAEIANVGTEQSVPKSPTRRKAAKEKR